MGHANSKFAWVTDTLRQERERRISINVTTHNLRTSSLRAYTLVDVPGHKYYKRNMITGISLAESAVLVIAQDTFEKDYKQTKETALIAMAMGCSQLIVAVNSLDMLLLEN
jgi:translation elongation factor EF-1alpha